MQLLLKPILLSEDLTATLREKQEVYNKRHPDEPLTTQQTAEMFLEYAIKYLDITAID